MKILDALRNRRPQGSEGGGQSATSSPDEGELPIAGYDNLGDREIGARLPELSQVELDAVETYERSHQERPKVLDKLRYMRESEPLPDYDALTTEQIGEALAGADAETVKGVRDYERKFKNRPQVMDEVARILPTAKASPGEDRAREEREERLREGFADREKTGDDLAG